MHRRAAAHQLFGKLLAEILRHQIYELPRPTRFVDLLEAENVREVVRLEHLEGVVGGRH